MPKGRYPDARGRRRRSSRTELQQVGMALKIIHGPKQPLIDRETRLPPKCLDSRAIEKDEGTVAHPSTLTPGELQLRRDPHALGDQTDRVVYLAVLVRAEVEDIDAIGRLVDYQEFGVAAVVHVQVGRGGFAVTNVSLGGCCHSFFPDEF